jgi:hypothetical protein
VLTPSSSTCMTTYFRPSATDFLIYLYLPYLCGGMVPHFLNVGTRFMRVVIFMVRLLCIRRDKSQCPLDRTLDGLQNRPVHGHEKKSPCPLLEVDQFFQPLASQFVDKPSLNKILIRFMRGRISAGKYPDKIRIQMYVNSMFIHPFFF